MDACVQRREGVLCAALASVYRWNSEGQWLVVFFFADGGGGGGGGGGGEKSVARGNDGVYISVKWLLWYSK